MPKDPKDVSWNTRPHENFCSVLITSGLVCVVQIYPPHQLSKINCEKQFSIIKILIRFVSRMDCFFQLLQIRYVQYTWASAAGGQGGRGLPWIFKRGTNIVDRGLKVLFFGLFLLFFGLFSVGPPLEEANSAICGIFC